MTCDKCQAEIKVGDWPFCPHGTVVSFNVQDDSFPGGQYFEHVSHTGETFYSKTELKSFLKATGQMEYVRHVGEQGSDKSKHTSRWI